jgi:hypothetical protein
MCGEVIGITIVALVASGRAASATPCAWFPAEAAITPRQQPVEAATSCCRRPAA